VERKMKKGKNVPMLKPMAEGKILLFRRKKDPLGTYLHYPQEGKKGGGWRKKRIRKTCSREGSRRSLSAKEGGGQSKS